MNRRHRKELSGFTDWAAVFIATTSFIWIVLWAASPDSEELTAIVALLRSLGYSIPITLGMWGIARATRPGSSVPSNMAKALPYARLGKDGKVESVSTNDPTPTPLEGQTNENN